MWLLASVRSDVHVEVRGAPEPPLAIGTGIRPFSSVDPFVEEKLTRGQEGLATLGALVRAFPCVSQVMPYERRRLGKPLSALGTCERLLPCVCVEVFTMSPLGFKALGTLRTAERPQVTVAALMPHQLPVREESLVAGGAKVRPFTCVSSFVSREAG